MRLAWRLETAACSEFEWPASSRRSRTRQPPKPGSRWTRSSTAPGRSRSARGRLPASVIALRPALSACVATLAGEIGQPETAHRERARRD